LADPRRERIPAATGQPAPANEAPPASGADAREMSPARQPGRAPAPPTSPTVGSRSPDARCPYAWEAAVRQPGRSAA